MRPGLSIETLERNLETARAAAQSADALSTRVRAGGGALRPRHNVDRRNGAIPAEQADLSRRLKIPVARLRWQVRAQRRRPALFRRGVHGGDGARFSSARRLRSAARGAPRAGGKWRGAVRDGRRAQAGNGGALSNRKTARIASHRQGCPTRKDAGRRFPLWRACGARFSGAGRLQSAARGAVACGREMVGRFPTGKQRALRCTGRSAPRERMPSGIFHRGAPEKRGAFSAAGADALRRFPQGEPVRPPLNPGISVALPMPQPANPCARGPTFRRRASKPCSAKISPHKRKGIAQRRSPGLRSKRALIRRTNPSPDSCRRRPAGSTCTRGSHRRQLRG